MREGYQSANGASGRLGRAPDEMRAACGRAIAFIMALAKNPDGGNPDIATAIAMAKRLHVAAAMVLSTSEFSEAAVEATRNAGKKGNTLVQALEYDPAAAIPLTREAGGFELFGLPYGLLVTMHAVAESLLDDYEGVLVMDAAQCCVTASHLRELCLDAFEHPEAEVVASLEQQQQQTPCWISRAFLDRLAERDLTLLESSDECQANLIRLRDKDLG